MSPPADFIYHCEYLEFVEFLNILSLGGIFKLLTGMLLTIVRNTLEIFYPMLVEKMLEILSDLWWALPSPDSF